MTVRITLDRVSKAFGAVRALNGVSLSLAGGKVFVVSGPNGSGKSTLLSILGTLAGPTTGTVDFGDLGQDRARLRATLGWLGHDSFCYGDLTGRENLELAARLHGRDPAGAFARADERFRLPFADRAVRTLSRGQRQRIALARALVAEPSLLLLDEPTTGLDAASVERLASTMKEETARGALVVLVTHDATFGRAAGDEHVELDRGRRV